MRRMVCEIWIPNIVSFSLLMALVIALTGKKILLKELLKIRLCGDRKSASSEFFIKETL